jgi:hypothetical protein
MQLTPMRFTTVEGTEVTVKVNSPAEAKLAIKELRHRKKEIGVHRRALLRMQKAAAKERARLDRADTQRSRRRGFLATLARAVSIVSPDRPLHDLDAIQTELNAVDDTLHNLDLCIVQIEGKLLSHD